MDVLSSLPALGDRVLAVRGPDGGGTRLVVGIVGEPGSGKSTVAHALAEQLEVRGSLTAVVPMDGFHLANAELARLGRAARKGAPDTFDAQGYAALLRRLRTTDDETVYAPAFERSIEEAVAGSIAVPPDVAVVLTEGNYLLQAGAWSRVRSLLDLTCAVEVDGDLRRARLLARHVSHGRSPEEAQAWMRTVDEPNAAMVRATMSLADVTIRLP